MKKTKIFAGLLILALVVSLAGTVAAAPPTVKPDKAPPDISRLVFVHYPQGKGWGPGGNPGNGGGGGDEGGKLWYKYSGLHWTSSDLPINYYVTNAGTLPAGFLGGIQNSFATWDNASAPYSVTYSGPTTLLPGNFEAIWDANLGRYVGAMNVVGWKDISANYPNAIGVTSFVYYTGTKEIIEVDTALNSNPEFTWWQMYVAGDPNIASWPAGQDSAAYDVDVQNIMTHEAGHWLILEDLYQKPAGVQTMYGISAEFELQKRSLEGGDLAGTQTIYP